MTNYVILARHDDSDNEWVQFTAMTARSARSAISQALEGDENAYSEGTFVAVPARSWRPTVVKAETKTTLTFS